MKYFAAIWQLAALATCLVIPDDDSNNFMNPLQDIMQSATKLEEQAHAWAHQRYAESKEALEIITDVAKEGSDDALNMFSKATHEAGSALEKTFDDIRSEIEADYEEPQQEDLEESEGHHGHTSHLTVYQIISNSNYTTKLAKLIDQYDDIVEALNGTSANFTVFAPTDRAFEKIPWNDAKPSKSFLKSILSYHISPELYPSKRILVSRTIPTLLKSEELGKKSLPQRLRTDIGLRGLTVNFYSRVIAVNINGKNGVIHGVDSILVPPPKILDIVELFPGAFSTLDLGLVKTGLLEELNSTSKPLTTFAPTNFAFQKLGPKVNAFLFSKYGLKYLKSLLKYHFAPENVLYSDEFYKSSSSDDAMRIPKGIYHVDLPTLLDEHSLGVDVARWGRFISIKINGFGRVAVSDVVAKNGVIHVIKNVLIPPKELGRGNLEFWDGETEIEVDDLKARLEPYVSGDSQLE